MENEPLQWASSTEFVNEAVKATRRMELLGLHGSCNAYLLARLLERSPRPLVVITADNRSAEALAGDLAFYSHRPDQVGLLPAWEVFPFEPLTPHPDIEAQRLATLDALQHGKLNVVVAPVQALMQRMIPRAALTALRIELCRDQEIERGQLTRQLQEIGYAAVSLVEDRGTFSVRGDLLDIFPPGCEQPLRIDFFGDQIERIRPFDATSQRTLEGEQAALTLLPARELVLAGEPLATFTDRLRAQCEAQELPRSTREAVLEEVREGILAPGRAFLLPLNYPRLDSLFDYLRDALWVMADPSAIELAADGFDTEIHEGHQRWIERGEIAPPADSLYLTPGEVEQALASRRRIDLSTLEVYRLQDDRLALRFQVQGNGDLRIAQHDGDGLLPLVARLRQWQQDGWRVLLVCHQQGQARRLCDLLEPHGLHPDTTTQTALPERGRLQLTLGELSGGFRLPDERLVVITEEEIFGPRRRQRQGRRKAQQILSSLAELKEGDYVVHTDHGIGRYLGLMHLSMGAHEGDFLHLEYAGEDKLYLPVDRIEKISRYQGADGQTPKLDKMGGQAWEKTKLRARAAVEELARQLLQIYAKRELRTGFAFSAPDRIYREFEAEFPFEETPDQQSAIDDVLDDMLSERPMDRLVCGDVGYGKTEVAIRAAFKAVLDGKQVAVLVPTTILAGQHFETFRKRMDAFPVEIEMISRFRSAAQVRKVLQRTAEGRVDILIGTHRLLQRDVRFKDLGLMVIDEEQRFGVAHKERLKKFRAEVDVLTLSATPIPRTLHMSMAGLRDLSVIDTPPIDRRAIRTYVTRFEDELVRQAILRELQRGGQVFFVHNRVQTIDAMAEQIRQLVPEAKVAVGHGQMAEKELEQVMLDFISGNSQILVASTIIENGLDIPRANTMIVNRADCFGLSQLYQLRGRVGRSNRRAYAYLLIPGESNLTRDARERLRVLQELTELGAGFRVASHDLELRGAGDLLGGRQSGQIAAIGFDLYTELLEEAINELKGREHEQRIDPELRLGVSAFLPEGYVADPSQRLVLYQRLAAAESDEDIYAVVDELTDRFGSLPPAAELLVGTMRLRVLLKALKVEQAEYDGQVLTLSFHASTPASVEALSRLLADPQKRYALSADYRLTIRVGRKPPQELLALARKELQAFF